jgi:RecA/RadA recombinase
VAGLKSTPAPKASQAKKSKKNAPPEEPPEAKKVKKTKGRFGKKEDTGPPPAAATIRPMSERVGYRSTSGIATGILPWDALFGSNQMPMGIFIDIAADSGIGKTTATGHVVRALAAQGHKALYLDPERGLNDPFLHAMGLKQYVDSGLVNIQRPTAIEDVDQILSKVFLPDESIRLVVIDSLSALYPMDLFTKGVGQMRPGAKADLEGQLMVRWKNLNDNRENPATFIIILHMKTSWSSGGSWGGGFRTNAAAEKTGYMADVRIVLKSQKEMEREERTITGTREVAYGRWVWAKPTKSRFTRPGVEIELPIVYGRGISTIQSMMAVLLAQGYITQNSSWYEIGPPILPEVEKMQGQSGLLRWMIANHAVVREFVIKNDLYTLVYPNADDEA